MIYENETPSLESVWTVLRAMFGKGLKAGTLVVLREPKNGVVHYDVFNLPPKEELEKRDE